MKLTSFFSLFLFCALFHSAGATEIVIKDLSKESFRFDRYYQSYVPITEQTSDLYSKHFFISPQAFPDCYLTFKAKPGLTLLVENKLIFRQADSSSRVLIPLKKLEQYSAKERSSMMVTFFHERGFLPSEIKIIRIDNAANETSKAIAATNDITILPRLEMGLQNKVFYLFMIALVLLTLLKNYYPRDFLFFWALRREQLDDNLKPKILGVSFWIIISSICLLASISFFLLYHETQKDFWVLTKVMMAVLIAITAKLFYNFLLAIIFGTVRTVASEFLEFLRVVVLAFAFIGSALLISYITVGFYLDLDLEIFFAVILVIMLITVIRMILVQFNILNARNLHIISYICAAEILPLVVAAKVLLFR
jgi:hypothetical protein